jgi:hypothetical protein
VDWMQLAVDREVVDPSKNGNKFCMLYTMHISILLRQTNKCTHIHKYIIVMISPLHIPVVKPPSSGDTKGHKHRFASSSHVMLHLRVFQCLSL